MNIIVNVDKHWAIGHQGTLLFPVSADLKRFAQFTTGKVVVMGRSTLESLPGGKPLKNRENIVLSRNFFAANVNSVQITPESLPKNLSFCASITDLHTLLASERFKQFTPSDIFVIGGQSVYEQLLGECDTAYITKVEAAATQADSFFPNLDTMSDWQITENSEPLFQDSIVYRYITYKKKFPVL